MEFRSLVFPAPEPSYNENTLENLLYIPKPQVKIKKGSLKGNCELIPCLYLPYSEDPKKCQKDKQTYSNKPEEEKSLDELYKEFKTPKFGSNMLILYFHGNAEDIGIAYNVVKHFREFFKVRQVLLLQKSFNLASLPSGRVPRLRNI